jgi:serine kinase of HPr protein (carbohydrate metabolism regulator)
MPDTTQLHATTVSIDGCGIVIRGPSGSGKSDLALRLIGGGAALVADDRTDVIIRHERLIARAPENLAGLLEVYGIGIVEFDAQSEAEVAMVAELVPRGHVERLPKPANTEILGIVVPLVHLDPFEISAPIKLRLALDAVRGNMRMRHGITN